MKQEFPETGRKSAGYELLDHTADTGARFFAPSPDVLFETGACAMLDILAGKTRPKAGKKEHLSLEEESWEELLVAFLRELLYGFAGRDLLTGQVRVTDISPYRLTAEITVIPFDPAKMEIETEIKAVTYHQAMVRKTGTGWQGRVVFDV